MNRWVALLLAVVAGGVAAFGVILGAVAVLGGVLWIFVFGDDPWPASAEAALNLAVPVLGLILWALFGWVIWRRLTAPLAAG